MADNTYQTGDSKNCILKKILRVLCGIAGLTGSDWDYKTGDSDHIILRKICWLFEGTPTPPVPLDPLALGLISSWHLNEVSGTRFDLVGGNNMVEFGTPTQEAGRVGFALGVDGISGLTCPGNASLDTAQYDFTFASWVWLDSLPAFVGVVLSKSDVGGVEHTIEVTPTGSVAFYCNDGGMSPLVMSTVLLGTGSWFFVTAGLDAGANRLFVSVNGGTPDTSPYVGPHYPYAGDFMLGGIHGGSGIIGRIDEVLFWKRLLTGAEVARLYNGGAGISFP